MCVCVCHMRTHRERVCMCVAMSLTGTRTEATAKSTHTLSLVNAVMNFGRTWKLNPLISHVNYTKLAAALMPTCLRFCACGSYTLDYPKQQHLKFCPGSSSKRITKIALQQSIIAKPFHETNTEASEQTKQLYSWN